MCALLLYGLKFYQIQDIYNQITMISIFPPLFSAIFCGYENELFAEMANLTLFSCVLVWNLFFGSMASTLSLVTCVGYVGFRLLSLYSK